MPGLFIMIEGTDGSGKGTQTDLLVERLKAEGHPVQAVSFPRYGERSAAMVEDYLHGKYGTAAEVGPYRASIFYAADRYAASAEIRQWLNDGKIVIANRYVGSNMGHQGGKILDPIERGQYFTWVRDLEYTIFGIPKPDVNLILHVPAEVASALIDQKDDRAYLQGKKRDIHEADLGHLKAAEVSYLDMAARFPEFTLVECAPENTLLSKELVHDLIWRHIAPHLN